MVGFFELAGCHKEVIPMGFYGSGFFKSWLVGGRNVEGREGPKEKQPKVSMIITAVSAEDACEKMRSYLTDEGFKFGPIAAFFG